MASDVTTTEEKPGERTPHTNDELLYSTFSKTSKRWIPVGASFAAMFSGLSSFIYYPAVTPIAEDLHTSIKLVNLTITSYLIVSGLVPSVIGDLADRTGRRPMYIATFTIYFAANVGLALQDSYAALFVLRMLQSAGSSGQPSSSIGGKTLTSVLEGTIHSGVRSHSRHSSSGGKGLVCGCTDGLVISLTSCSSHC